MRLYGRKYMSNDGNRAPSQLQSPTPLAPFGFGNRSLADGKFAATAFRLRRSRWATTVGGRYPLQLFEDRQRPRRSHGATRTDQSRPFSKEPRNEVGNLDVVQVREREVRITLDADFREVHQGHVTTVLVDGVAPRASHLQPRTPAILRRQIRRRLDSPGCRSPFCGASSKSCSGRRSSQS
jgi:hypothetical protein